MARAFGDGEEGDERRQKPTGVPDPSQGAAAKELCSEDENDANVESPASVGGRVGEEAVETQHIYLDFIRTEISRHGFIGELNCFDDVARTAIPQEMVNPTRLMDWSRAGEELRQIADAFSQSSERQVVRKRAEALALEALEMRNFLQLLQELFQGGGVTRERVLVLFFFCADVAISALRRGFHSTFHNLMRWSLSYISTSVAQYVHSVGGWGVLLRQSLGILHQVSACCAFVAVVAACCVYIRRNWS